MKNNDRTKRKHTHTHTRIRQHSFKKMPLLIYLLSFFWGGGSKQDKREKRRPLLGRQILSDGASGAGTRKGDETANA